MARFLERLYEHYGQVFDYDTLYLDRKTAHQHLMIFHNPVFGRVMVLDGVVQTTEADEFIYHEMLAQVPILAHGRVETVLVIGGGDGGILREISRHAGIRRILQVEIDPSVIELSRRYLPAHSAGAFEDPRYELVVDDGLGFLQREGASFDLILSDSTDPIGPGAALFSEAFYGAVRARLNPGGIFVGQTGVPFHQMEELQTTYGYLRAQFPDVTFYSAAVPSYVGGIMAFAWATDAPALRDLSESVLRRRYREAGLRCRYYNPAIHRAAFALPEYIRQALQAP